MSHQITYPVNHLRWIVQFYQHFPSQRRPLQFLILATTAAMPAFCLMNANVMHQCCCLQDILQIRRQIFLVSYQ